MDGSADEALYRRSLLNLSDMLHRVHGEQVVIPDYGAELRPAYLGLSIVSNYLEVTRFGLFGGLSLALGSLDRPAGRGIFRMALSYSLERLSAADVGQIYGFSHAINLGLSRAF